MKKRIIPGLAALCLLSMPSCDAWRQGKAAIRAKQKQGRIALSDAWRTKPPIGKALQFAQYADLPVYFQLIAEPKTDFSAKVDLRAWAELVKANSAKESTLLDRKDTELQSKVVAGRSTLEYEVTGELKTGVKIHYRNILLESGGDYCKLVCWSTPSAWNEAQPKFDDLVTGLP